VLGLESRCVHFDPYQMAAVAQRLQAAGLPMREFPQTPANLTAIGSNLFRLLPSARNAHHHPALVHRQRLAFAQGALLESGCECGRRIEPVNFEEVTNSKPVCRQRRAGRLNAAYPDNDISAALSHAIVKESARGLQTSGFPLFGLGTCARLGDVCGAAVRRANVNDAAVNPPVQQLKWLAAIGIKQNQLDELDRMGTPVRQFSCGSVRAELCLLCLPKRTSAA
jgi:hypothetical protein